MTLGRAPEQEDVRQTTAKHCEGKLSPTSIYSLLRRECHRLFPDDSFADPSGMSAAARCRRVSSRW